MVFLGILAVAALVAFANGANDNFKGVATLYGSGTTGYRGALAWATAATTAGAIAAVFLANRLADSFSGKGLVPDVVTQDVRFLVAVGLGAGGAVLLASRLALPVSTTHALLGALIGAGWVATSGGVAWAPLTRAFVAPLLLSPILAAGSAVLVYPTLRALRLALRVERAMCLCVNRNVEPIAITPEGATVLQRSGLALSVGQLEECRERYLGSVVGLDAQVLLDRIHFLSGGLVCFARGMNDAPKIAAILIAGRIVGVQGGLVIVALVMAVGGLVGARRVAEVMSHRITPMNHGQAFTANAVTAIWVLLASGFGLPVSTTHVSVGSLSGIGAVTGQANWRTLAAIATAWVTTLPAAAVLGAEVFMIIR